MLRPLLCTVLPLLIAALKGGGGAWEHIGPWNIFDGKDNSGEAGTLACAASPKENPDVIYAGGSNNGASSGVIKTIDGGKHWTRNSNGIWDTRVLGVWVHPDDPTGGHVLVGTSTGIYESVDAAASWTFLKETTGWGNVMSFREGVIKGEPFIFANSQNGILTRPRGGGVWKKIASPGGIAANAHLSIVITPDKQNTEVLVCIGGWAAGKLYYASLDSATTATWTGPIKSQNNTDIDCANAAVDPNDRNHLLYSKAREFHLWESYDGGKTVHNLVNHNNVGTYFVMIGFDGRYYTATQSGAFVSSDKGKTWDAYHAIMHPRTGKSIIDRVPHDYQRIIPDFRGDQIAFPSDQGLHIVDDSSKTFELFNAIGDMHNTLSLSAIISPNAQGSRNVVSNTWDWNVGASWDDGKTWPAWNSTEKNPYGCGEGGGGQGMGASGRGIMFHHRSWWSSEDGGRNWVQGNNLLSGAGAFDYVREPNSRSEPSGTCFALLHAPATTPAPTAGPFDNNEVVSNEEANEEVDYSENDRYISGVFFKPMDTVTYLMTSKDFGQTWAWVELPSGLQAEGLTIDPTNPKSLFAFSPDCLANSKDNGVTWSTCNPAPTLKGPFYKLIVKSSKVMFMLRKGVVPLRTIDGGVTWTELSATAPLFKHGVTMDGMISWSGSTLILKGNDRSAIARGEYGTKVWKSVDDGDKWVDETGDMVTISLGQGVWYEKDFYLVTGGEGILVKRNLEA